MIGIRTNKENLSFDIENKIRYSQLFLGLFFAYFMKEIETVLLCLYSLMHTRRGWENSQVAV